MTDLTPPTVSSTEQTTLGTSVRFERLTLFRRLLEWAARVGLQRKVAISLASASALSGFITYLIMTGTPLVGADGRMTFALLTLDLVLLLCFGAVVINQIVDVWGQRRRGLAGSRLHVRMVVLFSAVAITPTIMVAIFSYVLLNIAMDSWFSDKVRTALSESRAVAKAYSEEQLQNIRRDTILIAEDLTTNQILLRPEQYADDLLDREVGLRSFSNAIVYLAGTQNVVASSSYAYNLRLEFPTNVQESEAIAGGVSVFTSLEADRVRALVTIRDMPGYMLYAERPVDPRVLGQAAATNQAVDQYEKLEEQRSSYQVTFILIFGAAALLLLLAAVWIGLNFATSISRRISALVIATERVRAGDLSARVIEAAENDEFGTLSRAFNRMTGQLESQQSELVEANSQLDFRRRFTEAVLSGVSAGVVGLDEQGLINLPNRSASILLGMEFEELKGQALAAVVPEMAQLIEEALQTQRLVEGQIRLLSRGNTVVLLVRISAERGQDHAQGFVVTFDDITELLGAQRKAAWADVARRIAHEIKNPLTPIQLSAERLQRKYQKEITTDPEVFQICTDTIIRQVGDIGRMVDEFSSFARMPAPIIKPETVQEIIRQAVFLQKTAHGDITFDLELPPETVEIYCDARQISQALINLVQNAIDSIHARQVSETSAGRLEVPGRVLVSLVQVPTYAALVVDDNGKGLPKEERDRLTEPYVTTRTKGTGLGLAIVKKIMEDHAGELLLEDSSSGGARVTLVFPTARREPKRWNRSSI